MTRTSSRVFTVLALALGALSFAAASSAHDGQHRHHGKSAPFRYTTTVAVADKGCDDHVWANDTTKRTYVVKKNDDGSYRVTAIDRGLFTTVAGVSPQGCAKVENTHHGATVTAGVKGHFAGYLTENITGGTFDSKATCAAVCDRAGFVKSFFGASAQENLNKDMSYLYVFMSQDPSLKYHVWLDRGHAGATPGSLKTVDRGDIATA
jgi:hypothetical protein